MEYQNIPTVPLLEGKLHPYKLLHLTEETSGWQVEICEWLIKGI
jgi:hypothetical protein